jgi:hypothetical protein
MMEEVLYPQLLHALSTERLARFAPFVTLGRLSNLAEQ